MTEVCCVNILLTLVLQICKHGPSSINSGLSVAINLAIIVIRPLNPLSSQVNAWGKHTVTVRQFTFFNEAVSHRYHQDIWPECPLRDVTKYFFYLNNFIRTDAQTLTAPCSVFDDRLARLHRDYDSLVNWPKRRTKTTHRSQRLI